MKLKRITKLRHRVFRDFAWPSDLHDFGRFNVVYGWNGSGKTTLSSLLALVEKRSPLTEGELELELEDGKRFSGAQLGDPTLPQVRVFDRDFIRTTLSSTALSSSGTIAPIFFLGEDSLEKQQEIERLRGELTAAYAAVASATDEKKSAEEKLDAHCVAQAKVIKAVLTSANSTAYNNYDKRKFRQAVQAMSAERASASLLDDAQKARLRTQKDAQPKPTIESVRAPSVDLDALTREVESLVGRSVVAQTLDELTADPNLAAWVQRGLVLHSGQHATETCHFCAQPLKPKRRAALEAHFNDAFAGFQKELNALATKLHAARQTAASSRLPEPTRFYETLSAEVASSNEAVSRALTAITSALDLLLERVEQKRTNPFVTVPPVAATLPSSFALRDAVTSLQALVEQHNQTSHRFQASVEEACRELEASFVAEAYPEHAQLAEAVKRADESLQALRARPPSLQTRIDELERAVLEHRRPAEELTEELRTYLGRDELRFEVKGNGYTLTRHGLPVSNLSEGERTAIAFLYFLKSLEDKTFDVSKGIVVIDDPVSSLDANALFSAFSYLKERTKRCGQLILLTHDFAFFRLVKSWFQHLPNQRSKYPAKRPARLFQLRSLRHDDGSRASVLGALDPLLGEHESEYHYLFKRVHDEAHRANVTAMEQHYGIPSLARRLLDTFFAFRFPEMSGDLTERLDRVVDQHGFDASKRMRILRLLHTGSHGDTNRELEQDLSLLSETQPVLLDLLDLMEAVDAGHVEGLKKLVARSESTEEETE